MEALQRLSRTTAKPFNLHSLYKNLHTAYLFTASDFLIILVPNIISGMLIPPSPKFWHQQRTFLQVILRLPWIALWIWTNLFACNVSNQCAAGAVDVDLKNKPWRPLPSGRVAPEDAIVWKRAARLAAMGTSLLTGGGLGPCVMLQILAFLHDDLMGGEHWVPRNLLNGGAYLSFLVGATQVATRTQALGLGEQERTWLIWTFSLVVLGVQLQDIYDQEGDRESDRKTIPIILGDIAGRWTVIMPVAAASLFVSLYWNASVLALAPVSILGFLVIMRLLINSKEKIPRYDKQTFHIWNLWIAMCFTLPLWA